MSEYTLAEFAEVLTDHKLGFKEGSCFTPARFRGTWRTKDAAEQIGVLVLDSDTGQTLEEIEAAVRARDWTAIIAFDALAPDHGDEGQQG